MIGMLTFHWADDYGAMLQAYALKRCLESFGGRKVKVIPYAPVKLTGRYWLLPVIGIETDRKVRYFPGHYGFIRNVSHLSTFFRRRKNMRCFRHMYLTREPAVRKACRLSLKKYTHVFIGSDQVWNPEITVGLDDAYLGNIREKGNCRLIAYGASLGKDSLPEKYCADFKRAVNQNFSAVSMREKSAVSFVKNFFQGDVTDVLDPTLLLTSKEWEKIAKLPKQKGYILYIFTEYNAQMQQYIHDLSVKLRKEVIQVTMPWIGHREDWIRLKAEGGPSEYIGFFQNADCVVTNSFHGAAFSIIMEKKFLVFSHSDKNVRLENLLERLDLKSRLVERGKIPSEEEMQRDIDWEHVGRLVEKERELSTEFIKRTLSCPEKIKRDDWNLADRIKNQEWMSFKKRRIRKLENLDFTIIASNCVGTIMYHDLGIPFLSPTINLTIGMNDFVRFAKNLREYMEEEIVEIKGEKDCPAGMLGDIRINFVHYDTFEEGVRKWQERKKRINWDNLFLIGMERDGCTYETIQRFDKLPYENKVILTHVRYPEFSSAYYIGGFEENEELGNVLNYKKQFLRRRYLDDFDYVTFLNSAVKKSYKFFINRHI